MESVDFTISCVLLGQLWIISRSVAFKLRWRIMRSGGNENDDVSKVTERVVDVARPAAREGSVCDKVVL